MFVAEREIWGGFGAVISWEEFNLNGLGPCLGGGVGTGAKPAIDARDAFVLCTRPLSDCGDISGLVGADVSGVRTAGVTLS